MTALRIILACWWYFGLAIAALWVLSCYVVQTRSRRRRRG